MARGGATPGVSACLRVVRLHETGGFEDEIEVYVSVEQVGTKSVTYTHEFRRGTDVLAKGRITAVCIRTGADHKLESIEIPPEIARNCLAGKSRPE